MTLWLLWRCYVHMPDTRLTALCPWLPRWAGTRKVKPIWILLKQETVSCSGISWAICKSASRYRQITMPTPHHSVFSQAGYPSCRPTNSVKALKAITYTCHWDFNSNIDVCMLSVCRLAHSVNATSLRVIRSRKASVWMLMSLVLVLQWHSASCSSTLTTGRLLLLLLATLVIHVVQSVVM